MILYVHFRTFKKTSVSSVSSVIGLNKGCRAQRLLLKLSQHKIYGAILVARMLLTVALDLEVVVCPLFTDSFAADGLVATCSCDCVPRDTENGCGLRCRVELLDSHGNLYAVAQWCASREMMLKGMGGKSLRFNIESEWAFGKLVPRTLSKIKSHATCVNYKSHKIRYPRRVSRNRRKQPENSIKIVDDAILLFGIRPKTSI